MSSYTIFCYNQQSMSAHDKDSSKWPTASADSMVINFYVYIIRASQKHNNQQLLFLYALAMFHNWFTIHKRLLVCLVGGGAIAYLYTGRGDLRCSTPYLNIKCTQ